MTGKPAKRSSGNRIFRALLRLLPADFRVEHGSEMEQVFSVQRREANRQGTVRAIARLWFETIHDLLTTAPRQHAAMLRQDVTYTLRTLRRSPGFTAAAVATLAVGISASATIFTIINAFLFRPLPVESPHQLVSISTQPDQHIEMPHGVSFRDLQDYRELTDVFTGLLGYQPEGVWLDADDRADRVVVEILTENSFSLLGVRAAIGRTFTPADAGTAVVVLTHEYWRGRFAGDPTIVGRSVRIDGQPFTVIGVADERFAGLESLLRVSAFVPLSVLDRLRRDGSAGPEWFEKRDVHQLLVIGRLRPGVSLAQARARLAVTAGVLQRTYPDTNNGVSLLVVPETHARPVPQNGPIFHVAAVLLALLAGLLLSITSANIANLLLTRAASRDREMAMRAALGARTGRIVRQLFTEGLVLALLGCAAALWLAVAAASAIERAFASLPFEAPLRVDFSLDWRVISATVAVAIAAGVIACLAPAVYAYRADVNTLLKSGRRDGSERKRMRSLLVVSQVAVSLVLLIVGGLFVKTLERARSADLGFRSDHILLARVDLERTDYTAQQRRAYFRETQERISALPGIRAAAWISGVPFGYTQEQTVVQPEGMAPTEDEPASMNVSVSPEYFAAADVAVISGRPFDARDAVDAPPVGIVNQTLARRLWPTGDPIGRRVTLVQTGTVVEIVGVVKNGKYLVLWEAPRGMLYQPLAQATLEVLTAGPPVDHASTVRSAMQAIDPEVPPFRLESMEDYLELGQAFLGFRIGALISSAFGVIGLMLASIGLYGVVSYDITQRTHEIGVRMALGAFRADILRDVVSRGARLAAAGAIVGSLLAAAIAWQLRIMLLDVSPFDPLTYGATMLTMAAVCLLASFMPALRAASASPLDALRAE